MNIPTKKKLRFFVFLYALFCFLDTHAEVISAAEERSSSLAEAVPARKEDLPYVVGPRNMIQIKIFGDASTHQIYRVDESGFINHALIGRVKIAGLTTSAVEKMMESRLDKDYIINPRVNVFVLQYSTFSIIGEVRRPGNYEISGRVSVIEAISMAGGFTAVANQRGVKIMRKTEEQKTTLSVDTTRVTQQGDRSADVYIEQDDVVVVPKSFF